MNLLLFRETIMIVQKKEGAKSTSFLIFYFSKELFIILCKVLGFFVLLVL